MTTPHQCPRCGTELPAQVPPDQCPKCLLSVGLGSQPEPTKSAPSSPPPTPAELAPRFPQLEILELLGQGGMGVVYRARQPRLDRLVALKILSSQVANDPAFAERFTREARALARLNHPNIVTVYDFGEADGMYYLLMEHVDGANLRHLEQLGSLSPAEALKIVPAICSALQYAHDQGIVHRDIKPENVLINKAGQVKIADFGLAKLLGRPAPEKALTHSQQVMGTPHYMAPEQIESPQQVDHRADIYSLGVVFYEMLTGELPIGRFEPPSARTKGMQIDVRLDEVVLRALEKEPWRRYQKASEVQSDVETISSGAGGPAPVTAEESALARRVAAGHRAVRGPAIGLLSTGILNWLLLPVSLLVGLYMVTGHGPGAAAPSVLGLTIAALLVVSTFLIFAGLKMKALEAYPLAVAASVLCMIVSPGNLIGLPLGVWALVTLLRADVREAFAHRRLLPLAEASLTRAAATAAPPPADRARRWFFVTATGLLLAIAVVFLLVIGLVVASMVVPAMHKARDKAQQIAATASARQEIEAWLAPAMAARLETEGIRYDRMSLTLDLKLQSGRCTLEGIQAADPTVPGQTAIPAGRAEFLLARQSDGAWQVQGQAALGQTKFLLTPPPAAPQGAPPADTPQKE